MDINRPLVHYPPSNRIMSQPIGSRYIATVVHWLLLVVILSGCQEYPVYVYGSMIDEKDIVMETIIDEHNFSRIHVLLIFKRTSLSKGLLLYIDAFTKIVNERGEKAKYGVLTDSRIIGGAIRERWDIITYHSSRRKISQYIANNNYSFAIIDTSGQVLLNYAGDIITFETALDRILGIHTD